jgi:hypothetical protein
MHLYFVLADRVADGHRVELEEAARVRRMASMRPRRRRNRRA